MGADALEDAVRATQHFVVREAKDSQAGRSKQSVACDVVLRGWEVVSAIDLHDEARRFTEEVGEVGSKGLLAPELRTIEAPTAEHFP